MVHYRSWSTYSVVAFIVKVRLVEKKLNMKDGSVSETNPISQKRLEGTTFTRKNKALPSIASQEVGGCTSIMAVEVFIANERGLAVLKKLVVELWIAEERV